MNGLISEGHFYFANGQHVHGKFKQEGDRTVVGNEEVVWYSKEISFLSPDYWDYKGLIVDGKFSGDFNLNLGC